MNDAPVHLLRGADALCGAPTSLVLLSADSGTVTCMRCLRRAAGAPRALQPGELAVHPGLGVARCSSILRFNVGLRETRGQGRYLVGEEVDFVLREGAFRDIDKLWG